MPNHVHLIAVPHTKDGLARAVGAVHRRYTRRINLREKWRGHLWQEKFASFPMNEQHLLATARYVEMNPVGARLVENREDYRWSSIHTHLVGKDDELTKVAPLLELIADWHKNMTQPQCFSCGDWV
jgi:putative transposase